MENGKSYAEQMAATLNKNTEFKPGEVELEEGLAKIEQYLRIKLKPARPIENRSIHLKIESLRDELKKFIG